MLAHVVLVVVSPRQLPCLPLNGLLRQQIYDLSLHMLQVGQHRPAVKGDLGKEEVDFAAAANAKVVKDAEEYYREHCYVCNVPSNAA
jgi:hypothetical protein